MSSLVTPAHKQQRNAMQLLGFERDEDMQISATLAVWRNLAIGLTLEFPVERPVSFDEALRALVKAAKTQEREEMQSKLKKLLGIKETL